MFRALKYLILLGVALYCGTIGYVTYSQRDMLYHPNATYVSPMEAGAPSSMTEVQVETEDGLALTGWYAPPTSKTATIVFFHGNGDNLQSMVPVAARYVNDGYGFLLAEYRGYSLQPGHPSEPNLYMDGRAYIAKLFDMGADMAQIVIMGHSLGTGVATQMAQEFHPAALVLLAPFTSITAMAEQLYPYFPVSFMILDPYETEQKIAHINTPLLVVHGTNDNVVPFAHGQKVFALAKEPKLMLPLDGRGHSDIFDPAFDQIELFIDGIVKR